MGRFHSILALAAVIAVAIAPPLAAAEDETDTPFEDTLAAALAGNPEARGALMALFNEVRGDSEAIAGLAVDLIGGLEGDPVAVTDAATLIADVASQVLTTQPIVRVSVDEGFALPPGAIGWDLGPPDAPVFPGFRGVTQAGGEIVAGASRGVRRPAGEGLLSDGLLNVKKFFVEVPDGVYRLILLTDDLGNTTLANPLGQAVLVNGVRTPIGGGSPDGWLGNGGLTGPGAETVSAGGPTGTQTGGGTVIYVEVINGQLSIEFLPSKDQEIFLTGLILEPVDQPSVLEVPDVFADVDAILTAEAIIAVAIGETLETIAAEAGDEGKREELLDLDEAPVEETDAVSPS